MNKTEKDLIIRLFDKIGQAAMQPTPRDLEAEQLINKQMNVCNYSPVGGNYFPDLFG